MALSPASISAITLCLCLLFLIITLFSVRYIRTLHSLRFRKLFSHTNNSPSQYQIAEEEGFEFHDRFPSRGESGFEKEERSEKNWMKRNDSTSTLAPSLGNGDGNGKVKKGEEKEDVEMRGRGKIEHLVRISSHRSILFQERGSSIPGFGLDMRVPEQIYSPSLPPLPQHAPSIPNSTPNPNLNLFQAEAEPPLLSFRSDPSLHPLRPASVSVSVSATAHQHPTSVPFPSLTPPLPVYTPLVGDQMTTTTNLGRAYTHRVKSSNFTLDLKGGEEGDVIEEGKEGDGRVRRESFRGARSGWRDVKIGEAERVTGEGEL